LSDFERIDVELVVSDIDEWRIFFFFFVPIHDTSKDTLTKIDPQLMVDIPERDMIKLEGIRIRRENGCSCEFANRHLRCGFEFWWEDISVFFLRKKSLTCQLILWV